MNREIISARSLNEMSSVRWTEIQIMCLKSKLQSEATASVEDTLSPRHIARYHGSGRRLEIGNILERTKRRSKTNVFWKKDPKKMQLVLNSVQWKWSIVSKRCFGPLPVHVRPCVSHAKPNDEWYHVATKENDKPVPYGRDVMIFVLQLFSGNQFRQRRRNIVLAQCATSLREAFR